MMALPVPNANDICVHALQANGLGIELVLAVARGTHLDWMRERAIDHAMTPMSTSLLERAVEMHALL